MSEQSRVHERYSSHPSPWPKVFAAVLVLIFAALAAWLVWVIALKVNPVVTSKLATWEVVGEHAADVTVKVDLSDDARNPRCLLRATAEDHTTVGEAAYIPHDGMNLVTIRTERTATSVESVGCTAKGQRDAR